MGTLEKLGQYIARCAYPYGATRTVLRGPVRGLKYEVQPGLGLSYGLGLKTEELDFLAGKVRPGTIVYDLGAHQGELALMFARYVGPEGRVYAFEPAKSVCRNLERNVRRNQFSNVEVVCKAATDTTGHASFAFREDSPTTGKLTNIPQKDVSEEAMIDVDTIALDDFVSEGAPKPDLIKIDVEGAGASVLRGAAKLIEESSPCIYMEMHGQAELDGLRSQLVARGYVVENREGKRVNSFRKYNASYYCYVEDEK